MISILLRFFILSAITGAAAFIILLPASRIAVALGFTEVCDALAVLRVSGGVALFSSLLALVLWRTDL